MPRKKVIRGGRREIPAQYHESFVTQYGGPMNGDFHHHPMLGYGRWQQGGSAWSWIKGKAMAAYDKGKAIYHTGKKVYDTAQKIHNDLKESKIISKTLGNIPLPAAQDAAKVAAQHGLGIGRLNRPHARS